MRGRGSDSPLGWGRTVSPAVRCRCRSTVKSKTLSNGTVLPVPLNSAVARFYADRTLTKAPITPADQAEAYFIWFSDRLSKTTGQIITVDGGLHEAFMR